MRFPIPGIVPDQLDDVVVNLLQVLPCPYQGIVLVLDSVYKQFAGSLGALLVDTSLNVLPDLVKLLDVQR